MKQKIIILILIHIALHACKISPEYFVGKWEILNVVENNESIDLVENWIHLKSDGTFESYDGELKKIEHGQWKYQFKERKLFIEGTGLDSDSQWNLFKKNDTLIFQSTSYDMYLISKKIYEPQNQ